MNEIIRDNKERQEICFPKRYRVGSDGNREIIMNEVNKFDIRDKSIINKK